MCKEVFPSPPSRNSILLWPPAFLSRKTGGQSRIEVFGKGFGEKPFYKWIIDLAQFLVYDLARDFGEVAARCSRSQ